jgi:hypothetical protein
VLLGLWAHKELLGLLAYKGCLAYKDLKATVEQLGQRGRRAHVGLRVIPVIPGQRAPRGLKDHRVYKVLRDLWVLRD